MRESRRSARSDRRQNRRSTIKDASGQSFDPEIGFSSTTVGEQLSSNVNLAAGDKALGFLTFQVPNGDKIATVQYGLNGGLSGDTGEWTVG